MLVRITCFIFGLFLSLPLSAQEALHPRGLINSNEVASIRERILIEPYQQMFHILQDEGHPAQSDDEIANLFELAHHTARQGFVALISQDSLRAQKVLDNVRRLVKSEIFTDPISRGLTRAALLKCTALAYDFCYTFWSENARVEINEALWPTLISVSSNMGFSANNNMASNWMGVRYSAVAIAACLIDNPLGYNGMKSRSKPFIWESSKRLQDHLKAVIYSNGWHGESMGYFSYDWSFIGPALVCLNNQAGSSVFNPAEIHPPLAQSVWPHVTATVNIETIAGRFGIKPDLSDDNLNGGGAGLLALAMKLMPPEQVAHLKHAFDHQFLPDKLERGRLDLIHGILYYPKDVRSRNPAEIGWCNYHDPEQGVVMSRNRFKDSNDIVFSLSATSRRVRGHKGPDTNTWRLSGLGTPWVIGGGRTQETHVQTNFFPEILPPKADLQPGTLVQHQLRPDGLSTVSQGSCMGVIDHERRLTVDYREELGCAAAVLMQEKSKNGGRWRIQTPEYMVLKELANGYLITAPNGSSMRVIVLDNGDRDWHIESGLHRYGGKTKRLNNGIGYAGKTYTQSRWIDVVCNHEIAVAITLQKPNRDHPIVGEFKSGSVVVGDLQLFIP